jgi:hypothetical protein
VLEQAFSNFLNSVETKLSQSSLSRRMVLKWHQKRVRKFRFAEEARKTRDPRNLMNFEKKVFSQNGEDGIIQEILKRIGSQTRFFVEFGIQDGQETCCRRLLEQEGWKGLWLEGDPESVSSAQAQFSRFPVTVLQEFITKENILSIFRRADVPADLDLLVIDIDGNDFWVWEQLIREYRARLVVIEYNSSYSPGRYWVMPYNPSHQWPRTNYFGASLKALHQLAQANGYRLVGCDSRGVNAFFVREDLINDQFSGLDRDFSYHYVAPKYNHFWFGHPRTLNLPPTRETRVLPTVVCAQIEMNLESDSFIAQCNQLIEFEVMIRNQSHFVLSSDPPFPVLISYYWKKADDQEKVVSDSLRTPLSVELRPGEKYVYKMDILAPPLPGKYVLIATLVQEGYFWFDQMPKGAFAQRQIEIQ